MFKGFWVSVCVFMLGSVPVAAQDYLSEWIVIDGSYWDTPGITQSMCTADDHYNIICSSFRWSKGYLELYFIVNYEKGYGLGHQFEMVPDFQIDDYFWDIRNKAIEIDRFLGLLDTPAAEPMVHDAYRVIWRAQAGGPEVYMYDYDEGIHGFSERFSFAKSIEMISYMEDGTTRTSTIPTKGYAEAFDIIWREALRLSDIYDPRLEGWVPPNRAEEPDQ